MMNPMPLHFHLYADLSLHKSNKQNKTSKMLNHENVNQCQTRKCNRLSLILLLPFALRHACQPIDAHRTRNVHHDKNPQDPEIAP